MAFFNNRGGARPPRQFDRGAGGPKRSFGGNRGGFGGGRPMGGEREMHTTTCQQCGNECQVPFRPNGRKPVFCDNCFQREDKPRFETPRPSFDKHAFADAPKPQRNTEEYAQLKTQIDMMQAKLDRIIKLVSPMNVIESVEDVPHVKRKAAKK